MKKDQKTNQTSSTQVSNAFREEVTNSPKGPRNKDAIRQNSNYSDDDKPVPDNNLFFEERSNALCSKGN